MRESLVQWTLLNNEPYLQECLQFPFSRKVGQEITTEMGRLDFVLENEKKQHLVVELETELNSNNKLQYCFTQVQNYKNFRFVDDTKYCILFAEETNRAKFREIETFGNDNNILIRTYSLNHTKGLYSETINRLSLNVGLALPTPKNYTICFLRWLNKIMKPFYDLTSSALTHDKLYSYFNKPTNFNCYKRLALDFEMFYEVTGGYVLTGYGEEFIANMNPFVFATQNVSTIDLSNEQRRLLLKVLTNGNWEGKVHKVNIYWFLRFIEITGGKWIPKKDSFDSDKLEITKGLFNVTYKSKTMKQFLEWCCNYCEELGLVERVKSTTNYDALILTPLGVDVNNIFSMDLTLKRSRMNLNFKYSE